MWNFMQVQLSRWANAAEPMIGPGGMSRQAALTEVQQLLDRAATEHPDLASAAQIWRAGAKDDMVFSGSFIWCIYEHPAGEDPTYAAMAWLDDLSMRGTGRPGVWRADAPGGGRGVPGTFRS